MWILILTLVGYSSQSGQAIESVPGFTNRAECMVAAQAWLDQVHEVGRSVSGTSVFPRALCVQAERPQKSGP